MQRPYTVAAFAAHAGSGAQQPPPPEIPRCACCGTVIAAGRVYCARAVCRSRWATIGRSTRRTTGEDDSPTMGSYSG